jgi:hypothetical protein
MPSTSNRKILIALRGTEEYARFLDRLRAKVRKSGGPGESLSDIAEVAIADLAAKHGLNPPRRTLPLGSNQHGEPKTV